MPDPVVVEDQSITTAGKQKLVIDRKELEKMSGKRVLVVDDVISTGGMQSSSKKATKNAANGIKSSVCGKKVHRKLRPIIPAQNAQSGRRIPA